MSQSNLTLDTNVLETWIGNEEINTDSVDPRLVNQLRATLNQARDDYKPGDVLPYGWHWLFFNPVVEASGLGRDGHPALGKFLPPVALPRRMWAGSRIKFQSPIVVGEQLKRLSRIKSVVRKSGKSGELCFVTVEHHIHSLNDEQLRLVEEHDIVYRDEDKPGQAKPSPPVAPDDSDKSRTVHPDATLLFRYSAVTFNGHRIHYDLDFCRNKEGYPGLVVHGPLIATLLLGFASDELEQSADTLSEFRFRAVSPIFNQGPFSLHLKKNEGEMDLWATSSGGALAMKCTAIVA